MRRSLIYASRGSDVIADADAARPHGALRQLAPDGILDAVIDFVAHHLPIWRDDPERPAQISETHLNDQLALSLNAAARWVPGFDTLQFSHEPPDDGASGRAPDIAARTMSELCIGARVYGRYAILLPMECKRLPTPRPGPNRDEREYVASNILGANGRPRLSGGIQRFKRRAHGRKHTRAVMIGYVQAQTPEHWFAQVNGWIDERASGDSTWCAFHRECHRKAERLHRLRVEGSVTRLRSRHRRDVPNQPPMAPIVIDHLWIEMSDADA